MTVSSQFFHLAVLILSGVVVGAVIDCIRIMQMELPKQSYFRRWATLLELGVWLLMGIGTYMLLFALKKGEWRGIDPLAQILGLLLYQSLFLRPIRFIGRMAWLLIARPIWLICNGVFRLVRGIFRIIFRMIMLIISPIFKICHNFLPIRFKKRK